MRQKLILPGAESIFVDSSTVVASTVVITDKDGNPLPLEYTVSGDKYITLQLKAPQQDTLRITYQVLPTNLNRKYSNKDSTLILPEITNVNPLLYEAPIKSDFKPFEGLNSKGSISRSITVGNNQDAVLNSSLNLQLAGKIGEDTEIRASITDNNIPVQSDGYTQQLREFDRVYIELENKDFGLLRAGDYNISSSRNHFLRFDKRISGAGIFTDIAAGDGKIPITAQGGLARGKFARNRFQGQEGNQGPYKLIGANGERFVIIISGSERVYIDGVLMKRGQQYDYVIDYNAGEITFTALQPITKERRIVVEFQYTEQNFLRSVLFGSSGFENDNFKANVSFYSEQDSKDQPLLQDLTDEEKRVLSSVGDDLSEAVINTISPSSYREDLILYELKDSLGYDSVLVYSTDSTESLYQASFTYLGPQKGDYVLSRNDANGRVFRWVTPESGIPQGDYAPVKQLIAPNQLQILSLETEANIGENQKLKIDLAGSKNDINLFSSEGEQNDVGAAGKFEYELTGKWNSLNWFSRLRYEFNQQNFRTVERIRNVEFARDWNLPLNYNGAVSLSGASLGIAGANSSLRYDLDHLSFNQYKGSRNSLSGNLNTSENQGNAHLSWLTSEDSTGKSVFLRESVNFRHFLTPSLWVGIRSVGEINRRIANQTDTLRRSSYQFLEYEVFTGLGDTAGSYAELSYLQRFDDTARSGRYQRFSVVNTYGLRSGLNTNFNSRLELFGNIRNLNVLIPDSANALQRTISSRINYIQRLFGNTITSTTFYETGSGTEPRRSFSYIEVPAGTGTYTYTDYNGNGLKELDEFEIAPTPDRARYVRVFTPSNEYLRTSLNKFGENLNINAPANWKGKDDIRNAIARFSFLFNYQLDRKTLLTGNSNNLNPFRDISDSNVVWLNNSLRNTLFFNRTATAFGMDYTYRISDSRTLLSFGIEQRRIWENSVRLRYQVIEPLLFKTSLAWLEKANLSENFSRRNFTIAELNNEYSLSYQPADKFVLTGKYSWSNATGMADEEISLESQDFGMELSYNLAQDFSTLLQLNYILNTFTGGTSNPAAFEMLEGLQPGKNGTWMLTLQKTLRKNILLSLNYSGRVSEDNSPVQTGSLQVKAFF